MLKKPISRRCRAVNLLALIMAVSLALWSPAAFAASVCRPGTEATCRPADAVDAVADYLFYLKNSRRERVEVDALYELFAADVRNKLSRKKFAGIMEDFFESSFNVTQYTVDSKVTALDTGEVACRATVKYIIYLNGILTNRSMNAVLHARYEGGEWKLSRAPSYKGDLNFQGMFP